MKYACAHSAILIAAAVCSQAIGAQGLTRAERPAINVGDTWVYQSRDAQTGEKRPGWQHVVSEVAPDRITVRSAKSQLSFTQDFNLIEIKTGETAIRWRGSNCSILLLRKTPACCSCLRTLRRTFRVVPASVGRERRCQIAMYVFSLRSL